MTKKVEPHKSSLGMEANIASLVIFIAMAIVAWIPYLKFLAWGVPLVFFFMEKESKFVKFQSVQALCIGILQAGIALLLQIFIWILTPKDWYSSLSYLTGRGWGAWALLATIGTIISIAITILIIYVVWTAFNYKQVELPVIGPLANKLSAKLDDAKAKQEANQAAAAAQAPPPPPPEAPPAPPEQPKQ